MVHDRAHLTELVDVSLAAGLKEWFVVAGDAPNAGRLVRRWPVSVAAICWSSGTASTPSVCRPTPMAHSFLDRSTVRAALHAEAGRARRRGGVRLGLHPALLRSGGHPRLVERRAGRGADAPDPPRPVRAGREDQAAGPRHAGRRRPVAALPQEERPRPRPGCCGATATTPISSWTCSRPISSRSASPGSTSSRSTSSARPSTGSAPSRRRDRRPGEEPARRHLLAGHPGPGQRPGGPSATPGRARRSVSAGHR